MCVISIDRYCVVVHPLGSRVTNLIPLVPLFALIWLVSCSLAVPFAFYNEVTETDLILRRVIRCRSLTTPEYDRFLTILAFSTQYFIPLSIATVAYCCVAFHMRKRSQLGTMTQSQINQINK